MSRRTTFQLALRKRGLIGTVRLLLEKRAKHKRLSSDLIAEEHRAEMRSFECKATFNLSSEATDIFTERADAMLADENTFFTFRYHLKGVLDAWNLDPFEHRYWPIRHYGETRVHAADTPTDVKIVWEINRFKDLPLLGIAAYLTHDQKYATEVYNRMNSWIEESPFMQSINWASPLEIAIRLISWTATLRLLSEAGFTCPNNRIARSIWEQVVYLNANLSTDKIVRSNHLIGECAGLYVVSSFFDFPGTLLFREKSKQMFTEAILEQTYTDGATRESSGWYHSFVTDFVEIVERTTFLFGDSIPPSLTERARLMKIYRNSIHASDGAIVKFGDFDNGKAIELSTDWRDVVFGPDPNPTIERQSYFPIAKHITTKCGDAYLFLRAGEFGWGGDGSSSHAHDDLLSPQVWLDCVPIIVSPGTYVYNGHSAERDLFRSAQMQNRIIIGGKTEAVLKPSFGWSKVGPDAEILAFNKNEDRITVIGTYENVAASYQRICELDESSFRLTDVFKDSINKSVEWNFHFHPRFRALAEGNNRFILSDYRNNHYLFELSDGIGELELVGYDYSPSYMVKSPAQALRLKLQGISSATTITFELTRSSK